VCLVPDAGSYRYEDALQWSWFKTSAAHNTVTLGDASQLEGCGRLVDFETGAAAVCVAAEARTYAGVLHRREVTVADRSLVIGDFLEKAPAGTAIVWRLNSFVPILVSGNTATITYPRVRMTMSVMTEGAEISVAEVPLMGEKPDPDAAYVMGWQVRASITAKHESERILTRIDFDWQE